MAGDYFRTVGVAPALGRSLSAADQRPGSAPVAVISDAFWERRFARRRTALGAEVWIDGVSFTIVGVMPRNFAGTLLDWFAGPAFWIPLPQIRQMVAPFRNLDYENLRDMQWLMTLARLRPGVAPTQLQAALNAAGRAGIDFVVLPAERARFYPGRWTATVRILSILVAVAAIAMAIACFNLANLLLARAAARRKEIGVRQALGAGRWRLLWQFATENAVLAGCACALGLPVALLLGRAAETLQGAFGLSLNLTADGRALAATAVAGLLTAILAGVAPAWAASRTDLAGAIKDAGQAPKSRTIPVSLRSAFVVGQIACAMTTVVAAALLVGSLRQWAGEPLGYSPQGVLVGSADALSAGLSGERLQEAYRRLLAELRREAPEAALAGQALPTQVQSPIKVEPGAFAGRQIAMEFDEVSDGYFELLRIPVLAGRGVLASDDARSRPVVVLTRAAADLLWPGQNAIGRSLRFRGEAAGREVVGVVADVRYRPLGAPEAAQPLAFIPLQQRPPEEVAIHVRTPGEPRAFAGELRRIVARCADEMPVSDVQPLTERVEGGLSQVRVVSRASAAVAAVGVALALAGVFAAGAYRVAQRRREIAIRIAVGAEPERIMGAFARRGFLMGLCGCAAGLAPALWGAALLRAALPGVGTPGPLLVGGAAGLLTLAAAAASWAVARRISRVHPSEVLRAQ